MTATNKKTPIVKPTPVTATHHGITLTDDYSGLRDPGYPKVTDEKILRYLEEENSYFEEYMADIKG